VWQDQATFNKTGNDTFVENSGQREYLTSAKSKTDHGVPPTSGYRLMWADRLGFVKFGNHTAMCNLIVSIL